MTNKKIKRTVYTPPGRDYPKNRKKPPFSGKDERTVQFLSGNTVHSESYLDQWEYSRAIEQIHGSGLHSWGIAVGLRVSATLGQKGLTVSPGIALNGEGSHISLVEGGKAEVNPNAIQETEKPVLQPVNTEGVVMPTDRISGERYLTISWWETFDEDTWNTSTKTVSQSEHTPWLRLVDVTELDGQNANGTPKNDGTQIVLAKVTFDAIGNVTALSHDLRQETQLPTGGLKFYRGSTKIADAAPEASVKVDVDNVIAGAITPIDNGGLQITVPKTSDRISLAKDGSGNFAEFAVSSDVSHFKGQLSVQGGMAIGSTYATTNTAPTNGLLVEGNVGIGTVAPTEKLEVNGTVKAGCLKAYQSGGKYSGMASFESKNSEPPYISWYHGKPEGSSLRYGYIQAGVFPETNTNEFRFCTNSGANFTFIEGNVGIGTKNPLSMLQIGDWGLSFDSNNPTFGGHRSWMVRGTQVAWDTDNVFFGLKDEGANRKDSVIAWGDDLDDVFRFIFIKSGGEQAGKEIMRLQPSGNVGIGTTSPGATLDVNGVVKAKSFESANPLRHRMYSNDPIVYQDIFDAKAKGAIAKLGNPQYDETSWNQSHLWNDRPIIKYGGNNETDGNGAVVTIPDGYDTVWIRVLGEDRWNVIKAFFLDNGLDLGFWTGGHRAANCYCPDGSLSDSYDFYHQWLPIPAGRAGRLALIAKPNTSAEFWLSGLAFSKNPWAHAVQSAVGYHWAVNGGQATEWHGEGDNWKSDILSKINPKTNLELKVPIVPSGRDKLLYLVEHNNDWNGCMHNGITVNGVSIERFLASYDNPFARHWNSKWYERYIAARIPVNLIRSNDRYLSVQIDMSKQNSAIHFREIGTHDLEIPHTW